MPDPTPPTWDAFATAYGTQPGQQPDQTAGYGTAGQPYSGATPAPALPPRFNPRQPRKRRRWLIPALVAAALIGGVAVGSAGQPAPKIEPVTVAGPERVVNRDVPGPTKTVTPASCRSALDLAEQLMSGPFAAALGSARDILAAIDEGDAGALNAQLPVLTQANADLDRLIPKYKSAAAKCRAES